MTAARSAPTKQIARQSLLVLAVFSAIDAIYALVIGPQAFLVLGVPLKHLVIDQWRDGVLPLWSSALGAGHPLLADSLSLPLDWRNLFFLPFSALDGYMIAGALTRALGAAITFAYLRSRHRVSAWPAALGALVFVSSSVMIEEGLGLINGMVAFPALVWLGERLSDSVTRGRLLALSGAWGLFLFMNSLAYVPYLVLGSFAWCLLLAYFRGDGGNALLRYAALLAGAAAIGAALAAVVLVPTIEFGGLSNRGGEYPTDPYAARSLLSLFVGANKPSELYPTAAYFFYIGIVSFAPIVVALRRRSDPRIRAALALGIGTAALMLIGFATKHILVDLLPTLASFPFFRPGFLIGFAAAVLVARGLDEPNWELAPRSRLALEALLLIQVAAVVAVGTRAPLVAGGLALFLVGVRALGLGAAIVRPSDGSRLRASGVSVGRAALVGSLLTVELVLAWALAMQGSKTFSRSTPAVRYLQSHTGPDIRAMEILARPQWQGSAVSGPDRSLALVNDGPAYHGIPTANVYSGLVDGDYSDTFDDFGDAGFKQAVIEKAASGHMITSNFDSPLIRAFGVGYLYCTSALPSPTLSKQVLARDGYHVYAVKDPLPRAYFAGQARWLPRDALHAQMRALGSNTPGHLEIGPRVLLEGSPRTEGRPAYAPADVVSDTGSRVEVAVRAPQPGFLVLSDVDMPGWSAMVDGSPAAVEKANGFARAVRVPAGEHEVTFEYTPRSLRAGAALSIVTALGCVVVLAWPRRRAVVSLGSLRGTLSGRSREGP